GLLHIGARYFNPSSGRFATRDTMLNQHPFLYCTHDPVNWLDPTGHNAIWDVTKRVAPLPIKFAAGFTLVGIAVELGDAILPDPPPGVSRWNVGKRLFPP